MNSTGSGAARLRGSKFALTCFSMMLFVTGSMLCSSSNVVVLHTHIDVNHLIVGSVGHLKPKRIANCNKVFSLAGADIGFDHVSQNCSSP